MAEHMLANEHCQYLYYGEPMKCKYKKRLADYLL